MMGSSGIAIQTILVKGLTQDARERKLVRTNRTIEVPSFDHSPEGSFESVRMLSQFLHLSTAPTTICESKKSTDAGFEPTRGNRI
jgi:hypothetical protein